MQKNDYFFIKLIVILVVAILVLVSVIYLLQRGTLSDSDQSTDWSFNKKSEENTIVEDNNNADEIDELGSDNFAPEKLLPNRRYLETKASFCEEGVIFSCDEREFEFSDETGCGCELKKEFINNNPSPVEKNDDDFMPSEEDLPIMCTMEYAPVCGMKDGVYQTFGNDCMAEGAGVFDYSEGECE